MGRNEILDTKKILIKKKEQVHFPLVLYRVYLRAGVFMVRMSLCEYVFKHGENSQQNMTVECESITAQPYNKINKNE